MTAIKTLALGVVVLVVSSPLSNAAPINRGALRWAIPWAPPADAGVASSAVADQPDASSVASVAPPVSFVSSGGSGLFLMNLTAPATPAASISITPAPAPISPAAPAAPNYSVDALVNFGSGPYAEAGQLTTGTPQPWYTSPVVTQVFGGTPDVAQRQAFTSTVLQRVEQTYANSGVPLTLTSDPNVPAPHSISVVSNTGNPSRSDAIGIADVGNNGFTFIDKFSPAGSVDELEWAIAHNIAHEMMHTFGHEDSDSTTSVDGGVIPWSVLADPNTLFSADAAKDLLAKNFRVPGDPWAPTGALGSADGQTLTPVPEPATCALWLFGGLAFTRLRRRSR